MSLIAFVTDQMAIGRILDHLGLSGPEAEKPPPLVRELLRVAEHGDGWGVPAHWDQPEPLKTPPDRVRRTPCARGGRSLPRWSRAKSFPTDAHATRACLPCARFVRIGVRWRSAGWSRRLLAPA
jgi:hypothetical protein